MQDVVYGVKCIPGQLTIDFYREYDRRVIRSTLLLDCLPLLFRAGL